MTDERRKFQALFKAIVLKMIQFYKLIVNGGNIICVNEGQANISKFSEHFSAPKIGKGK